MPYLLDTNHCSYIMNGLNKRVEWRKPQEDNTINKFLTITETIYLSEVSLGELFYGAETSTNPTRIYQKIKDFRKVVSTIYLDEECWEIFAKIKPVLEKVGQCPEDLDLLIACIAKKYGCIFVTNDGDFKSLPAGFVTIENWAV